MDEGWCGGRQKNNKCIICLRVGMVLLNTHHYNIYYCFNEKVMYKSTCYCKISPRSRILKPRRLRCDISN